MKDTKDNSKKKRKGLIILCCVLAFILVALLVFFIWWKSFFGQMERIDGPEGTLSSSEEEAILNQGETVGTDFTGPSYSKDDATTPSGPADALFLDEDLIHILLVGQDRRPGQGRQRSDAMIMCTLNLEEKSLTFTSFLRDVWINIPNKYPERLNVPYAIGGFDLLNETLEYNFGIRADYNAEVDFSGFKDIIDVIGGVDIELTDAESRYLNKYHNSWGLQKGFNHLSGEQALEYARIRALDSDFGRTNRQRNVLYAIVEKTRNLSLKQLYALADSIMPLMKTDMTDADIAKLIVTAVKILPELTIEDQSFPISGAYQFASIDGKSVIYLNETNLEKNLENLKQTILVSKK